MAQVSDWQAACNALDIYIKGHTENARRQNMLQADEKHCHKLFCGSHDILSAASTLWKVYIKVWKFFKYIIYFHSNKSDVYIMIFICK